MPSARTIDAARRRVVPSAAQRSPWLAAVWTGAGTAVVGAVTAIGIVAICWLPASGGSGRSLSAIRAGLLSFLASVHGGITVAGSPATFLPLGMTVLLGLIAWRAGAGLADALDDRDDDPARLVLIGLAQLASFTIACLVAVPLATLGTSSAPFLGAGFFATLLFGLTGSVAYVRASPLRRFVAPYAPVWLPDAARVAIAGLLAYVLAAAVLVGASLGVHHAELSRLLGVAGPGWNGAPVVLLCILAAPNAVIAAASYLAGPGFAVGSGTIVAVGASTHGVLPAFPILAALPSGPSPSWMVWAVVTVPIAAGAAAGARAYRSDGWLARVRDLGVGAAIAGLAGLVLAWQGGGGIGAGRLHTIGASPWLFGLSVAGEIAGAGAVTLALAAGAIGVKEFATELRSGNDEQPPAPVGWADVVDATAVTERLGVLLTDDEDADGDGRLAG